MGACQFKVRSTGKTIQEAYYRACEVAVEEYGHQDGYNGTISTTHSFKDETEAYGKSKFNDVSAYINNRYENMNKRDCSAICIRKPVANKNKTKSQVEHVVTPGTKKWVLKYEVEEYYGDGRVLASCPQKGEAVKIARAYTEKTENPTIVVMRKLLLGPNLTAKITYKKATNERDGEWIFFGYAAE